MVSILKLWQREKFGTELTRDAIIPYQHKKDYFGAIPKMLTTNQGDTRLGRRTDKAEPLIL